MPFVAAVQTTSDSQPQFVCLRQQRFTYEEVVASAARSITPSATVVFDGLWQIAGADHERMVTGGGKASAKLPQLPGYGDAGRSDAVQAKAFFSSKIRSHSG